MAYGPSSLSTTNTSTSPNTTIATTHLHHMNTQDSQSSHWHYGDLDDSNFQVHGRTLLLLLIIFSLLILFTIFFFYIRWVLRYRRRNNLSIPTTVRGDATNVPANGSVGLDRRVIDNLPISLHRTMDQDGNDDDDDDEAQCSICLSVFEDQDKVKILPVCNHNYHPECVDKWLTAHSTCPLCRASPVVA